MTDEQWELLLRVIDGEQVSPIPVGFLIDGPWVSRNAEVELIDYFFDTESWLQANLKAVREYPNILWLPGFWAEYGMISNPPSFGAKCIWPADGFPSCESVLRDCSEISTLDQPDVKTDGLLPFIIQRLRRCSAAIEAAGHRIRFACSHGPITIASYLLGHNEFFLACRTDVDAVKRLLEITTRFVVDWLRLQQDEFPSIDGVLLLEDLMGFMGKQDFEALVLPAMREIFTALPVHVRFLHNDAFGLITAEYLNAMDVNLFNFSFEHSFAEIRGIAGEDVTLIGNIPPRDILGLGSALAVRESVERLSRGLAGSRRTILSAGGFTPSGFTAEKIQAFCRAAGKDV